MEDEIDTSSLLLELQEISNKRSSSRFQQQKKPSHCRMQTKLTEGGVNATDSEGDENSAARFLSQYAEEGHLNQYWYSETTIRVFCSAIVEALSKYGGKRVAFLSTPSLYFALPPHVRDHSFLFDVSYFGN